MSASIEENFPGTWTLSIADLTSDNSASGLVSYDGPGSSAEWIEEDPDVNGQQATLSNFGTAEFTNLGASGVNPGDSSFEPVDMVDGSGNILAYPGSLVNDSFTITYVVPLKILTTSIPAATDNSPGFYQSLAASRGIAPYQWSVYSSSLPPGLTLNTSNGAITGTATAIESQLVGFKVTGANGNTATAMLTVNVVAPIAPGPYSPLAPVRICDTRANNPSGLSGSAAQCNGLNGAGSALGAGGTTTIHVAGSFGVPSGATAVVLNVTAVNPQTPGYLTLFPAGSSQPLSSNINYVSGEVVPNLVEVGTGNGGEVSIYSSAETDVVVDVEGYVSSTASGGVGAGLYDPLPSPARICDTRAGNPSGLSGGDAQCNGASNKGDTIVANTSLPVQVGGNNGVPTNASAAIFNVTVVNPSAAGYLTVYPGVGSKPSASNVNYTKGQVTTNRVEVPLSTGASPGRISIYSSASADVVVDVSGYFSAANGTGTEFTAEDAPVRICDTRAGDPSNLGVEYDQCGNESIGPAGTLVVNVFGLAGVPSGAKAVVVNLTGVSPSANTFLTVFPGPSLPFTSDLNPAGGEVRANLTVATLNSNGTVSIYNDTGRVNVVVDVLGWYS